MPIDAVEGLVVKLVLEFAQLAFGAPTLHPSPGERGDTGGIVAAIFEPLERINDTFRHGFPADNADDATHVVNPLGIPASNCAAMRKAGVGQTSRCGQIKLI